MLKKITLATTIALGMLLAFQSAASAQHSLGISYENRAEAPTNGFGLQLESSLFSLPVVDFRVRGHFSYFGQENDVSMSGITYDEVSSYDFGGAGIVGISLGLFDPYAGVGIGSESWEGDESDNGILESHDKSSFYYYGVGGVRLDILPALKPYAEIRYSGFSEFDDDEIFDSDRRLLVGVSLHF